MDIKKVAVLGSGVMGSGIAAHMANAGIPVLLLDIVPPGAKSRNELAEKAVERMLSAHPSPFIHKSRAKLVTCGNLEDDLDKLKDVDWIVEAVLEKLEVKHNVYKKIDAVRKKGSVVSSNTSTLPLHVLVEGLSEQFRKDFLITHFFNPPRFMRLLELVPGKDTRKDAYASIREFADIHLGKGVVICKDTPGFIANRIGVYWMTSALLEAIRLNIRVEEADAVMSKPVGIPKTGVFGLFDLIGIDLMPLIAKSLLDNLPKDDAFVQMYQEPERVKAMIAEGYTGRKGKGGFYRLKKDGEKKSKEVIDLKSGQYRPEEKAELESVKASKEGLGALINHKDIGGRYARAVLLNTLHYTASLIPEIADDIYSVDEAMKLGYNWKYGPFELINRLGVKIFAEALKAEGKSIPPLIEKADGRALYRVEAGKRQMLNLKGEYVDIPRAPGAWSLADIKLTQKPLLKNASASLWDVGDGIVCFEITSKMNSVDPDILSLMNDSIGLVKEKYKGMIIGGDGDNFSVGANLGFILMGANMAAWKIIGDVIRDGQRTMMALKYAPFPTVAALHGMALGGGCEITMHCSAVQAHVESYPGLVEVGVGIIPGWGGCKEMLVRHMSSGKKGFLGLGAMPAISKVFEYIAMAKVATSAEEARDMRILREGDGITMNRARLLADAKAKCLELAKNYVQPEKAVLSLPGASARVALNMAVKGFVASGKATRHDETVTKELANVLSGGETDSSEEVTEQQLLDLEFDSFMRLIKTKPTLERIEHMLNTGKPLRN